VFLTPLSGLYILTHKLLQKKYSKKRKPEKKEARIIGFGAQNDLFQPVTIYVMTVTIYVTSVIHIVSKPI